MLKRNLFAALMLGVFLAGCHTDMWYQAKVTPYDDDETGVFKDGAANRPLPSGAVARGWEKQDVAKSTGVDGTGPGGFTDKFPASLMLDGEKVSTSVEMMKVLKRGKERYEIVCSHCHGAAGDGKGMINQRGLTLKREPATYHSDRLRGMPLGYFYDVISNGHGVMYSQASRVNPDDRWAIVAYVRALQKSQAVNKSSLSPEDQAAMEKQMIERTKGMEAGDSHGGSSHSSDTHKEGSH